MLDLTLGYVRQQDREREVVDDLRSRQALRPEEAAPDADRSERLAQATSRRPADARPSPVRARGTGA